MDISTLSDIDNSLADVVMETVDTPIVVLDRNGRVVRFNDACQRLTGYALDEALDRKIWDFLLIDEEIGAVKAIFEKTCAESLPTHFTNYWKTREGRRRLIKWSNKVLKDGYGEVAYVLSTGIDITDIRSTQYALSESQNFLRSVINASPVAIVTADEDGAILSFSRAAEEVFGYKEAAIIGKDLDLFTSEPDQSPRHQYEKHHLGVGEHRMIGDKPFQITGLRENGEAFPAVLTLSEFQDGQRIFVGFVEDVTEQKATERRLAETQDQLQHAGRMGAMGEIATSIAHELNQPLTAAASLAGAVSLNLRKADCNACADALETLDDVVEEIRRASDIIRNMRDFVSKRKSSKTLHDVNKIIEDACAIALIGADAHSVKVATDYGEDVGETLLDRIQIQQVAVNLVRNAVDAMQHSPARRLTISTRRKGGCIEVSIADTGTGVSEDMKNRLFEPFATSKPDGMGIGLSISKSIIDAHQGEIRAMDNDSAGTVFTFTLPVEVHDENAAHP